MAKMLDIIFYNNCICNLQDLVQEATRSGKSMVKDFGTLSTSTGRKNDISGILRFDVVINRRVVCIYWGELPYLFSISFITNSNRE